MKETAKDILTWHYKESIKGIESISTPHFPSAHEGAALAAMREIADKAWELGNKFYYNQDKVKSIFMKELFPETKTPPSETKPGCSES